MNKHPLQGLLRRTVAAALAVVLTVPTAFAAAGDQKVKTSVALADGLTYQNTVTVNNASRVESFALELSPDSGAYPILMQGSGTVYAGASINKVVSSAQQQGYHVLAAVNTDFFVPATGVPIGIVIEDGVYQSGAENEAAMAVSGGQVSLVTSPKVTLTLTNQRTGTRTVPHHFNKTRSSTGGLYLLNSDFSTVSTRATGAGWYVRLRPARLEAGPAPTTPTEPGAGTETGKEDTSTPSQDAAGSGTADSSTPSGSSGSQDVPGSQDARSVRADVEPQRGTVVLGESVEKLTVNATLELKVAEVVSSTAYPLDIGPYDYILTAGDASGYNETFQSFQVGDKVTLATSCADSTLANAQWAGGVGDIMVQNGQLTDSSTWSYTKDGRAPRTAVGVKADGTLLLYAVDGRQNGYSIGLSQKDLAEEMKARGCVWAANLDGGGSTAMSVWLPGDTGPVVKSIPSDGKPRSCATYLLMVTDDKGSGTASRLAWKEDGPVVLAGSSLTLPDTLALDSGMKTVSSQVSDVTAQSGGGLGTITDGVYTAGDRSGTDTIQLHSDRLGVDGTAQIHVVGALTSLTLSKRGSSAALTALSPKPGEQVQLAVSGSYWGRTALRDFGPVKWTVSGNVGTVDQNGLFTASEQGGSGSISATAGGITQTVSISMNSVHGDVPSSHWAYPAVSYCYDKGIVGGVSATEFGRDLNIRRADFMLMLYNAVGKPAVNTGCTFTDVSAGDYYYTALCWGQSVGLASGTGGSSYAPNDPITREQACTILRQALPLLGKSCPNASQSVLDRFADKDQIADYAKSHVATLAAQGIISGKGEGVDPKGRLTRAEMAVMLYQSMTFTPNQDVPTDEPVTPEQPADPVQPETPDVPDTPDTEDPGEDDGGDQGEDTQGFVLSQTDAELAAGASLTLTARNAAGAITWTSSDPKAASVSADGTITNCWTGDRAVRVTITAACGTERAACDVLCQPTTQVGTVTDAEAGLNVRSGPGTGFPSLGKLANLTQVPVLGEENGWFRVLYTGSDGTVQIGYVSGNYLTVNNRA